MLGIEAIIPREVKSKLDPDIFQKILDIALNTLIRVVSLPRDENTHILLFVGTKDEACKVIEKNEILILPPSV